MAKQKDNKIYPTTGQITIVIVIGLVFFILFTTSPIAYRYVFSDMLIDGMVSDCNLKIGKIKDGSPLEQAKFIDLEGYGEDKLAYQYGNINAECFQVLTHRQTFTIKYILFGRGSLVQSIAGITFLFILLSIVCVAILIFIVKFHEENDDDDYGY